MTSSRLLQNTITWLDALETSEDTLRFRRGLRVARIDTAYGSGVIDELARETNISKKTLYEWRSVALFMIRWRGLSARRTFEECPAIRYSHIRQVLTLEFEDAIEALTAIEEGDEEYPDFILPMTVDSFSRYLKEKHGRPVPESPLFDKQGEGWQVFELLRQKWQELKSKRIRVTVKEVE